MVRTLLIVALCAGCALGQNLANSTAGNFTINSQSLNQTGQYTNLPTFPCSNATDNSTLSNSSFSRGVPTSVSALEAIVSYTFQQGVFDVANQTACTPDEILAAEFNVTDFCVEGMPGGNLTYALEYTATYLCAEIVQDELSTIALPIQTILTVVPVNRPGQYAPVINDIWLYDTQQVVDMSQNLTEAIAEGEAAAEAAAAEYYDDYLTALGEALGLNATEADQFADQVLSTGAPGASVARNAAGTSAEAEPAAPEAEPTATSRAGRTFTVNTANPTPTPNPTSG
jgi:hypothetical protein